MADTKTNAIKVAGLAVAGLALSPLFIVIVGAAIMLAALYSLYRVIYRMGDLAYSLARG